MFCILSIFIFSLNVKYFLLCHILQEIGNIENNIAKIFSIRYDINIFRLKNNFRNGGIVIMNNNNEKNNIKMTKNRKIILETIDRYNAPITAEELFL